MTVKWYWEEPGWDDKALETILDEAIARGEITLPEWRYPPPKTYLSFTPEQRICGWQKTWAAIRLGLIPRPSRCSICLTNQGRMQMHAEDYTRPLNAKPICPACHRRLHMRFRSPEQWRLLVFKHAYSQAWFLSLAAAD